VPKSYLIVRCKNCGRYTYAPKGQKTRLCVYCGKIIRVDEIGAKEFPDAESARRYVQLLNAGYIKLQTKNNVSEYIESNIDKKSEDIVEGVSLSYSQKQKRILQILSKGPITLTRLLSEAEKYGVDEDSAKELIEKLNRDGLIYFPKPWIVALVEKIGNEGKKQKVSGRQKKLVLSVLKKVRRATVTSLIEATGLDKEVLEDILQQLINDGVVIKPKSGTYEVLL